MQLISITTLVVCTLLFFLVLTRKEAAALGDGAYYRYNKGIILAFVFTLMFVASLRSGFVDTLAYKYIYAQVTVDNWRNNQTGIETGFIFFICLLKFISADPQFFVMVTSVLILGAYTRTIVRYADDLPFSLYLFFFLEFMTSMNGIRQYMVSAMLLLAIPLVLQKRFFWYAAVVLLLSTMHTSVLVCIPLYFVVSRDRPGFLFAVIFGACIFVIGAADSVFNFAQRVLPGFAYVSYLDPARARGMNLMRLAVNAFPVLLLLLYNRVQANKGVDKPRHIVVFSNYLIIGFFFSLLSAQMLYFSRIGLYYSIGGILVIPHFINTIFVDRRRVLVKGAVILMYGVFFCYQIYTYYMAGSMNAFRLVL